jgi:hypothetical protein
VKFALCGGTFKGRSIGLDGQECTNLYLETSASPDAKEPSALIGTPGLKLLSQIGTSSQGCRGLFTTARDRLLMVVGSNLYEVSPSGSASILGHLNTYKGTVSFAEIDKQPDPASAAVSQVMLVDGVNGYILNTATNVFSVITGDYMPGTSVISQNGFFLQNINDSNKFIYSNYLDGLNWEASFNFFAAESSPDPILTMFLINNQVWLMGSKSIEVWTFTGDPDALWTRSGVGFINVGLVGKYSATLINGHVFWIGSGINGQNTVWHSGPSYMPERVSTNAIENIIGKMGQIDDCVALSYMQEGHQFAIFNFPSGNRTLCYDMSTQMWHERGDFDVSNGINNRHRAMYLTNWQNNIMVGDDQNNNLYIWDLDQYTDNGKLIRRIRVAPHIHNERHRVFFHQMEIDMERGVGNTGTAYGSDPQVMLEYSNDGGYSYVPLQVWAKIGKIGERLTRVRFNKLGMSRDRVFRVSITEPIKVIIIGARLDLSAEKV